ncbi:hypothetical protein [Thermobacillus sp. ZCTH02-B1]|uniref:hypothetical protein n=1 Tax=Thermobacillus sp. ZCTH02-B1 TaxID=1858795 RepID=UPI0025F11C87|nr:hypothetical protein [Thermobacillus sp. ZCTH02-B1]
MRGLPGGRTAVLLLVALMLSLALPAGIGGTGVAGAEGSNERHLYVFADGPIDDLKIRKSSGGGDDIPFSEAPVTGNGYVRYAFELEPGNCFVPESSNHRFSVDPVGGICIWGNETDFVVRAFSTGAQVHLITMDQQVSPVWMEPEGEGYRLYGSFYFIEIDDADDYKLGILYPSSGSPDLASCPGHFDDAYYNYLDFSCLFNEIPHTIGVYAWSEIQNDWIPTNLMWRVEDPGNISVVDHAPGIRVVDPGIRLEDGHAESDIALYSVLWGGKIQPKFRKPIVSVKSRDVSA